MNDNIADIIKRLRHTSACSTELFALIRTAANLLEQETARADTFEIQLQNCTNFNKAYYDRAMLAEEKELKETARANLLQKELNKLKACLKMDGMN